MKIGLLSYPMLFQQVGGLPLQVRYTADALRDAGHDARLFDWRSDAFADFDVIHVFAVVNGNHRLVDFAKGAGCAVVLSTVLHPPWSRRQGQVADVLDRVVGRLTRWQVSTSFRQIQVGLQGADAIVALGNGERTMLVEGYGADGGKIRVVPNGIEDTFFSADGSAFRQEMGLPDKYALIVGEVGPYKNQLSAAQALRGVMPLVLVGPCPERNRPYLDQVMEASSGEAVYAGTMSNQDPMFASAYGGASVFVLPSQTEVQPISALEALAAGTPVVLTRNNSFNIDLPPYCYAEVDPRDIDAIRSSAIRLSNEKSARSEDCRGAVAHLKWHEVARQLVGIYEEVTAA